MALNQVNPTDPKAPKKSKLESFMANIGGPIMNAVSLGASAAGAYNSLASASAKKAEEELAKKSLDALTKTALPKVAPAAAQIQNVRS